jgi:hypothetical protein
VRDIQVLKSSKTEYSGEIYSPFDMRTILAWEKNTWYIKRDDQRHYKKGISESCLLEDDKKFELSMEQHHK